LMYWILMAGTMVRVSACENLCHRDQGQARVVTGGSETRMRAVRWL